MQIITISNFALGAPTFRCAGVGHTCKHGKRSLEMFKVETVYYRQDMDCNYLDPGQHIDEACGHHAKYWCVGYTLYFSEYFQHLPCPSARAVGRVWAGNSGPDSPSKHFYVSLAAREFPLPWIKAACFSTPNHLWFQCFKHGADLQINANGNKLVQNWNCPFSYKWFFL